MLALSHMKVHTFQSKQVKFLSDSVHALASSCSSADLRCAASTGTHVSLVKVPQYYSPGSSVHSKWQGWTHWYHDQWSLDEQLQRPVIVENLLKSQFSFWYLVFACESICSLNYSLEQLEIIAYAFPASLLYRTTGSLPGRVHRSPLDKLWVIISSNFLVVVIHWLQYSGIAEIFVLYGVLLLGVLQ